MSNIYVAKKTAFVNMDGKKILVKSGVTRVREGHDLVRKHPELFEELVVHYEYEEARQEPEPVKRKGRPRKGRTETARQEPKKAVEPVEGRTYKVEKEPAGLTTMSLEKNDESGNSA